MYDSKKMFILGMARSGYEAAKVLSNHNCNVLITDSKQQDEEKVNELKNLGIDLIISLEPEKLLDDSFDYVVKNPGIKLDHNVCLKAESLSIPIINELEVAYHYLSDNVKIIGITGSNGKTTTTTLTYEILKNANLPVHLGGNIGYPLCSLVNKVKENDILVLELSGHQFHDFKDFKVDIGVMTNLSEVHIDHFKTYENYKNNKVKIFRYHDENNIAILNKSNKDVIDITKDIKSKKIYFSSNQDSDLSIKEKAIYYFKEKINELKDIKLKGNHNYENIMCAIAIAKEFNVTNEIIREILTTFSGVEHRLEYVKTIQNRDFYNDSKATNVESTIIALNSFEQPTILLLGGLDRGHSFDKLIPYMNNVKLVCCYGETKDRIEQFCNDNSIKVIKNNSLNEAVNQAYNNSNEFDVILLSPACASWDQYDKFEDRGNDFKNIINNLE